MTVAVTKRRQRNAERNIARAGLREALRQARDGDLAPLHGCLRVLLPAEEYADALTGPKGLLRQLRRDRKCAPSPER
jgi:hypothetical protein